MAVAAREGGPAAFSASRGLRHTYYGGGLDNLGGELRRGVLNLPEGVGGRWEVAPSNLNERGNPVEPARIPQNEQIIAYGAVLQKAREHFESFAAETFGEDEAREMVSNMSKDALRAWTQISFLAPGGSTHQEGRQPGAIGMKTVMTRLKNMMESGEASGLGDVLTQDSLRQYVIVQRAIVGVAEAKLIERFSHIPK
jgi:hypothetical protein